MVAKLGQIRIKLDFFTVSQDANVKLALERICENNQGIVELPNLFQYLHDITNVGIKFQQKITVGTDSGFPHKFLIRSNWFMWNICMLQLKNNKNKKQHNLIKISLI